MRELKQILEAFDALAAEGKAMALATVVAVSGSAYRRPGARMLVAADGRSWGGVSGGCLERDVSRRARNVVTMQTPVVCTYDTSDELRDALDELSTLDAGLAPGATLGCRGVIDIFIEPVSARQPGPMPSLARCVREREPVLTGTVVRTSSGSDLRAGERIEPDPPDEPGSTEVRRYDSPAGEWADVFVEMLRPPQSIVIFGGGSDVVPVVELARTLGWHVTVVAGRTSAGVRERFAGIDRLVLADSDPLAAGLALDPDAAVVLMTHDVRRDAAILRELVGRPLRYLGVLGPRSRTDELIANVAPDPVRASLFYPVGLDIGADQPELIALAIVGEIQCVLSGRPGGLLRDRPGPVYPSARNIPCDPIR